MARVNGAATHGQTQKGPVRPRRSERGDLMGVMAD